MPKEYAYGVIPYKLEDRKIKILLCKSVKSFDKWGCLKGVQDKNETAKQCAKREFFEESSIKVNIDDFEEYFSQENESKDIGIWLINSKNVLNINSFFYNDTLYKYLLSWENSKVKFFDIDDLPRIKKKQKKLIKEVKDFLRNKHRSH